MYVFSLPKQRKDKTESRVLVETEYRGWEQKTNFSNGSFLDNCDFLTDKHFTSLKKSSKKG